MSPEFSFVARWLALLCLAFVGFAGLAGCTGADVVRPVPSPGHDAALPARPAATDTITGSAAPAVITLGVSNALEQRPVADSDSLPGDIQVGPANFSGVPVGTALEAVLAGSNISISWQAGHFEDREVSILNLTGSLAETVAQICDAAGIYCAYHNHNLELKEKETFVIEMPPVAHPITSSSMVSSSSSTSGGPGVAASSPTIATDTKNTIADAIAALSGNEVKTDDQGGNIIYSADTAGHARVEQYLEQLRRGRPLIVMQLYIWEVNLSQNNQTGIDWNASRIGKLTLGGVKITPISPDNGLTGNDLTSVASAASTISSSINFGALLSGAVDAAAVISFLQQYGSVETVSDPQMTFVSGSSSKLVIGNSQQYISGVGELVASSISGGTTGNNNSGIGTNTVQTSELDTGLTVVANASYENGVVFGALDVEQKLLTALDTESAGGTVIQLPQTQDRILTTILRLRPGDTLLLGGLRSTADNGNRQGVPTGIFGLLPTLSENQVNNDELVIMVRPSIVRFADEAAAIPAASARPLPLAAAENENEKLQQAVGDIYQSARSSGLGQGGAR